jgi:hypothetical protein
MAVALSVFTAATAYLRCSRETNDHPKASQGGGIMKLASVLDALRSGAVLHFSLVERPRWELYETGAITTISSVQVRSLLRRGAIAAAGDTLFAEVPSQTWRYAEPIEGAP